MEPRICTKHSVGFACERWLLMCSCHKADNYFVIMIMIIIITVMSSIYRPLYW